MLVRLFGSLAVVLMCCGQGYATCAQKMDELASHMKDTDSLTSKYNRLMTRIDKQGRSANLVAEGCRLAKQLAPRLTAQLSELKESGCTREPATAAMMSDILRGHQDDLSSTQKFMASGCP